MFCKYCGKEIADEAVICVGCGRPVAEAKAAPAKAEAVFSDGEVKKESNGLMTAACVLSFLVPIVGLILSIVGLSKAKTKQIRKGFTVTMIVSIAWMVLSGILLATMGMF